jgi:hypothetical protein
MEPGTDCSGHLCTLLQRPSCLCSEHVGTAGKGLGQKPCPWQAGQQVSQLCLHTTCGLGPAEVLLCSLEALRALPHFYPLSPGLEGFCFGLTVGAGQEGCSARILLMTFLSLQVIQEVSGLPSEGPTEGNQYTPDSQRLNCQKVRLCPARTESPIPCFL